MNDKEGQSSTPTTTTKAIMNESRSTPGGLLPGVPLTFSRFVVGGNSQKKRHRSSNSLSIDAAAPKPKAVFPSKHNKKADYFPVNSEILKSGSESGPKRYLSPSEIHDHDVILARGGAGTAHPGNEFWKEKCAEHGPKFRKAIKCAKRFLAEQIVTAVTSRNPPGRFITKKTMASFEEATFEDGTHGKKRKIKKPNIIPNSDVKGEQLWEILDFKTSVDRSLKRLREIAMQSGKEPPEDQLPPNTKPPNSNYSPKQLPKKNSAGQGNRQNFVKFKKILPASSLGESFYDHAGGRGPMGKELSPSRKKVFFSGKNEIAGEHCLYRPAKKARNEDPNSDDESDESSSDIFIPRNEDVPQHIAKELETVMCLFESCLYDTAFASGMKAYKDGDFDNANDYLMTALLSRTDIQGPNSGEVSDVHRALCDVAVARERINPRSKRSVIDFIGY